MKWLFAFFLFCFFVVPAMGATIEKGTVSESGNLLELSSNSARALVVFDALLDELSLLAGVEPQSGDQVTKLADVFLKHRGNEESATTFLTDLNAEMNIAAAGSGGMDDCYDCVSLYFLDSVVTLFYLASNIMQNDLEKHNDSVSFVGNLDYLKYLVIELDSYGIGSHGSIDSEYIDALKTAIDGWEKVRDSDEGFDQEIVVFDALLDELNAMAGSKTKSGDLFIKLTDVFLGDSSNEKGKSTYLTELMDLAVENALADSASGKECYECASIYLLDSVDTLFYIAGELMNDDEVVVVENIAYLKYLLLEMEYYGGVDADYIDAVQVAIDGWEKIYGTQKPSEVYIADEYLLRIIH
jgi:hypothetical protein